MSTYRDMEEVLKLINQKYISLDNHQSKYNNKRTQSTLWNIIQILQEQDTLFDKLFEQPYFSGSYYDNLKVGKPDEFDLDLLLVIPKICETHKIKNCQCITVVSSNKPGFFWLKIQEGYCAAMDKFIKDGYIHTDLVLNWLKSNITIALNKLVRLDQNISDYWVDYQPATYYSESGPALTLQLYGDFGDMLVDLVPAFKFGPDFWPKVSFRSNNTTKEDFFLVPKGIKATVYGQRYWRASFQEQEKQLIKAKERLKPALRLLKKMRNNLEHDSVCSYAIKTLVLWESETSYFGTHETLSDVFMKLLEKYKDSLYNKKISYYWNKNKNLLDDINPVTLENHHNEINRLLKTVKNQYKTDPCVVAKVILKAGTQEYKKFITEYNQNSQISNTSGIVVSQSRQSTSYFTFDPSSSSTNNFYSSSSTIENQNLRGTKQQTEEGSSSGWATAAARGGILLGIGALVAVAFDVLSNKNRNQN